MAAKRATVHWLQGPLSWLGAAKKQKSGSGFSASKGPRLKEAKELATRLLELGGERVVIPFDSEEVSALFVAEGSLSDPGLKPKLQLGEPNDCHGNAARLWKKSKAGAVLVTGYALSDGVWRRHSWVTDGATLFETTEAREAYFGASLPKPMAKSFYEAYA